MSKTVIELQNIKRNFRVGDETVHALRGVSFSIKEGEFVTITHLDVWTHQQAANIFWTEYL